MLLRAQGRAALPRGDTQIQPGELANRARQRGAAFPLFQLRQLAGLHRADGKMGGTTRCVVDEWELIRLNVVLGRQLGGCVPDERDPAYVLTIAERPVYLGCADRVLQNLDGRKWNVGVVSFARSDFQRSSLDYQRQLVSGHLGELHFANPFATTAASPLI